MCFLDLLQHVFEARIKRDEEVVVCDLCRVLFAFNFGFADDFRFAAVDLFEDHVESLELLGVVWKFTRVLTDYFLDDDEFSEVSIGEACEDDITS